jgi:hypothetical protein
MCNSIFSAVESSKEREAFMTGAMRRSLILALVCTVGFLSSSGLQAEDKIVKPVKEWQGKFPEKKDEWRMRYSQKSVTEENAWADLWREWKFEKDLPKINFNKQVVLVDVAPGAGSSFQMATAVLTENGDLRPSVVSTKIAGPGFIYLIRVVDRTGVKTIRGVLPWLAEWEYPNTVTPPRWRSTTNVHTTQFASTDQVGQLLRFYGMKFTLDKEVVLLGGKAKWQVKAGGGMATNEGVMEILPFEQAEKFLKAAKIDPKSFAYEWHSIHDTRLPDPDDKGKDRPVEVRVLNMSTPEYAVSIVVSRGNAEKHTHVVITYLRK